MPSWPRFSKIRKTWSFHVDVWQRAASKCTHVHSYSSAHVHTKPFVWRRSRCHCRRGFLRVAFSIRSLIELKDDPQKTTPEGISNSCRGTVIPGQSGAPLSKVLVTTGIEKRFLFLLCLYSRSTIIKSIWKRNRWIAVVFELKPGPPIRGFGS